MFDYVTPTPTPIFFGGSHKVVGPKSTYHGDRILQKWVGQIYLPRGTQYS